MFPTLATLPHGATVQQWRCREIERVWWTTANYVVWNVLSVATRTAFSIFHSKASHALAASGATWRTWLSRVLSALLYWLVQVGTPVNLHGNFKQGFPRSSPRYFLTCTFTRVLSLNPCPTKRSTSTIQHDMLKRHIQFSIFMYYGL